MCVFLFAKQIDRASANVLSASPTKSNSFSPSIWFCSASHQLTVNGHLKLHNKLCDNLFSSFTCTCRRWSTASACRSQGPLHQLVSANHQLTTVTFNSELLCLITWFFCQHMLMYQLVQKHFYVPQNLCNHKNKFKYIQKCIAMKFQYYRIVCMNWNWPTQVGCKAAYRVICGTCQPASILDMFGLAAEGFILQAAFQ